MRRTGMDAPLEPGTVPPSTDGDGAPQSGQPGGPEPAGAAPVHFVLIALGTIAFLYVGRPVVLPIFLAWMAATTLRPLVRYLSSLHLPTAFSAAVVFCLLVGAIAAGFL